MGWRTAHHGLLLGSVGKVFKLHEQLSHPRTASTASTVTTSGTASNAANSFTNHIHLSSTPRHRPCTKKSKGMESHQRSTRRIWKLAFQKMIAAQV